MSMTEDFFRNRMLWPELEASLAHRFARQVISGQDQLSPAFLDLSVLSTAFLSAFAAHCDLREIGSIQDGFDLVSHKQGT